MEHFNNYLILAMAVGLVGSVLSLLSHTAYKAESNMALGMLSVAVLTVPIFGVFASGIKLPDFDSVPAAIGGELSDAVEGAFSEGIREYVSEEYKISTEDVRVVCHGFSAEIMRAEKIELTLSGGAVLIDIAKLRESIEENFTENGKCEVKLNFG